MSIRASLAKLIRPGRAPTLERAEQAYARGLRADAAVMFRALAASGSTVAQLRLASAYERGDGVLQNFVEAVRWFRAAAEQDSAPAIARLGEIYLIGMAAPDTATPAALARMAASPIEDSVLNRLYPHGLAVAQDPEQAGHWNARKTRAMLRSTYPGRCTSSPVAAGASRTPADCSMPRRIR